MIEKILEVTVINGRNMPKMDTFGTCDPFVKVEFGNQKNQTKEQRGTYTPEFNETFTFIVSNLATTPELSFECLAWNRMNPAGEEIGTHIVPASTLQDYLLQSNGWEKLVVCPLQYQGKPKLGHNKKTAELTIRFRIIENALSSPVAAVRPKSQAPSAVGKAGPREKALELTVVSANNLPKMDFIGTIDPFCIVKAFGHELKTPHKRNTYTPKW